MTKTRNQKLIRVTSSNEFLKDKCVDLSDYNISMAYFTTIVTLLFDENDIFISLESSIHALQDGCSISVGYKI